jgi:fumarate hydratase, class I
VNNLGIGAQGLGGLTTVLDVKIKEYPTHAASLPVAIIPNCAANRHIHFELNGDGPVTLTPPDLSLWPETLWKAEASATKVNLDKVTSEDMAGWEIGQKLLLSGKILTARDAAHKRLDELAKNNVPMPDGLNLQGRFLYYVGPVDPVANEVVGPAGPTTATRMDKYTDIMLNHYGVVGMIGKAERGDDAIRSIKDKKAVYLVAVGGAAFLVSQAIKASRVVAFDDLGMEAIHEFEVKDMPVTVAVDTKGTSIHKDGRKKWQIIPSAL